MSQDLVIPELGESITEAQIVKWRKSEGDNVAQDEIVADLETDKATLELPSSVAGVIESILKQEGATVAVGEAIARISDNGAADGGGTGEKSTASDDAVDDGEKADEKPAQKQAARETAASHRRKIQPEEAESAAGNKQAAANAGSEETKPTKSDGTASDTAPSAPPVKPEPRLMPAAKEALDEYGIEPEHVHGTGPAGRILPRDVRRAARDRGNGDAERVMPMSSLHQQDAAAILDAWNTIPQAGIAEEIDLRALDALIESAGAGIMGHNNSDIHLTAYIAATIMELLDDFPELNAEVRGIDLAYKPTCHLAVLMKTENGDVAPVIRNANGVTPVAMSRALHDARQRALRDELMPEDLDGGTLTLEATHYGRVMYAIPSVRLGESAAFSINGVREQTANGIEFPGSARKVIVSMAYDQRIVSGARAEAALFSLKSAAENPIQTILSR